MHDWVRRGTVLVAVLFCLGGCDRKTSPQSAASPEPLLRHTTLDEWTHQEISEFPEEYLLFAARQVEAQIVRGNEDIETIERRYRELDGKSSELMRKVEEAEVVRKRLATAIRRAEDEERWPLVFAGRTFNRETATALLASVEAFSKRREPLAASYREALQRLLSTRRLLENDCAALSATREQIAIDLEHVQLNRGLDKNNELRRTVEKIASISKKLTTLDETAIAEINDDISEHQSVGDLLANEHAASPKP